MIYRGMRYIGAIVVTLLIFAIIVGGNYSRQEIVEVSIQLIPTPIAQPGLVESTLVEYNGIRSVRLSRADNLLRVTYDKARITLEDLNHILISLGYRPVPATQPRIPAAM